jgi:predicted protein tyrosine phosphatase
MPTIHVCPLHLVPSEAERLRPSALVTLLSPLPGNVVPTPPGLTPDRHLSRFFHDIAQPADGYRAPDHADVEAIIAFVHTWDRRAPLLIHCWAGISRSTAAAVTTAALLHPSRPERDITAALRAASPTATPNARMIALADGMLGRQGRLIEAVAAIGRGSEAPHGDPFELR